MNNVKGNPGHNQTLDVKVWGQSKTKGRQLVFSGKITGPFRVGRQDMGETDQFGLINSISPQSNIDQKLVIAFAEERDYSRHIADITFSEDKIEVRNTSNQLFLVGKDVLEPNQSSLLRAPLKIAFLDRTLHLECEPEIGGGTIFSLARDVNQSSLQLQASQALKLTPTLSLVAAQDNDPVIDSKRLLELLQTMLQIFQDSPNCQEFFDQAATAMLHLLQLDHVLIAFDESHAPEFGRSGQAINQCGKWRYQSIHKRIGKAHDEWVPSSQILQMVESKKETVYHVPDVLTESLAEVTCLVASPLLDSSNEMVGFVYGDRHISGVQAKMFNDAEAKFVELFANGISIGMQRLGQERKLSEMRSRFDQFFTPELARRLELDATLLEPRSANVSVLFGDIRGFSRISERIGPEKTISWINSVMNHLSDCVFKHDGVVVDYIGDEILAMWGAPLDREDHAELAVRAALEMRARLPEINAQWESVIGEPVEIGIGINSGEAQVGNIGSDRKFKYGPLGDVVNVASRAQSSTKQMGALLLATESTAAALPPEIVSRKIRSVRFVNVQRAISVYEVPFQPDENWIRLKENYETGLELYELGELRKASQQMASVINGFPDDGPSVHLLSDCVSSLCRDIDEFDSVWTLERK